MFELFPGDYRWSYNAWAALAAGGEFGDISLILERLHKCVGRDEEWFAAWSWLAERLERRAEENLAVGTKASASENYFLASLYHRYQNNSFRRPNQAASNLTSVRSLLSNKQGRCPMPGSNACLSPMRVLPCRPISFLLRRRGDLPQPYCSFADWIRPRKSRACGSATSLLRAGSICWQ